MANESDLALKAHASGLQVFRSRQSGESSHALPLVLLGWWNSVHHHNVE